MEVQNMDIDQVKPYENNPRKNDEAVDAVANSIKDFGWQQPIVVDKDHVIIVGHTRYKAALKLGYKKVPVVVASNLKPEQVKAYRLADNKSGELASWDKKKLNEELDGILDINMADYGFDLTQDVPDLAPEKPEVQFSEELLEKNNFIVLKFDNEVDWLQAETVFGLKTVKDGHSKKGFEREGIGRVIDGAKAIQKLLGENE